MSSKGVSPDTEAVMDRLDEIDTFALGGVGFAGSPNAGETIAKQLAQRADAIEAFAWLAEHGQPAARLYAYWALRTLAPARAEANAGALTGDPAMVATMTGCLRGSASVGAIALRLRDGNVDRPLPAR